MRKIFAEHTAYQAIFIFIIFLSIFYFSRENYAIVFDDTTAILDQDGKGPFTVYWLDNAWNEFLYEFTAVADAGYRPLSIGIASVVGGSIALGILPFSLWVAFVGVLIGLTAVVTFFLGRQIAGTTWGGWIAAFLLFGCPPFIAASWVVFAGIQTFVPLFLGCGVLLYLDLAKAPDGRQWRYVALALLLLFGPWVREFIAVLGPIIIASEIWRARRPTLLMGLGLIGFLHGLFPTALVHFIFAPDLPLAPVYKLGWLARQVSGGDTRIFRPEVALHALQIIPPSFYVIIFAALLVLRDKASNFLIHRFLRIFIIVGGFIVAISYWIIEDYFLLTATALFITAAPAALALRFSPTLAIWYTAAYLPFFKVYAQETHLAYMAQPLAIIAAIAVANLWRYCATTAPLFRVYVRSALSTVVVILTFDQMIHVVVSRQITKSMAETAVKISRYLSIATPAGVTLGANTLMGHDIQLFSRGHVRFHSTFPNGNFETAAIQALGNSQDVYLLAAEYPFLPGKIAYHRNAYVDLSSSVILPIGRLTTVRVQYFYLDPLRLLASRPFISFLGPPDMVNDVYAGPQRGGVPFMREHYVALDLYRVNHTALRRPATGVAETDEKARLIEEGRNGRNILLYKNRFYAVLQTYGPVDGPTLAAGGHGDAVISRRRLDLLHAALDKPEAATVPEWLAELGVTSRTPIPDANLGGFTVFPATQGVVAVPAQADSGRSVSADGKPWRWFSAPNTAELKRRILAMEAPLDLPTTPWLGVWDPNDMTMKPAWFLEGVDTPVDPALLYGVWRFRGMETRILPAPNGGLRLINERGDEAVGTLRGQRLSVPGWSREARVSPDGRIVDWGDYTRWRR